MRPGLEGGATCAAERLANALDWFTVQNEANNIITALNIFVAERCAINDNANARTRFRICKALDWSALRSLLFCGPEAAAAARAF